METETLTKFLNDKRMNNKQQTAVEWLEMEIKKFNTVITREYMLSLCQQAKEMEKEQHGKTWDKSMYNLDARGGNIVRAWVDFDEYYNETYGGGEQ